MTKAGRGRRWFALLSLSAFSSLGASAAVVPGPGCAVVATYTGLAAQPGVLVCLSAKSGYVYTSSSQGDAWTRQGRAMKPGANIIQLVVSPRFQDDHTLWVESDGPELAASHDGGRSFASIMDSDPAHRVLGGAYPFVLSAFVTATGGRTRAALFVTGTGAGEPSYLVDPLVAGDRLLRLPAANPDGLTIPLLPPTVDLTQPLEALTFNSIAVDWTEAVGAPFVGTRPNLRKCLEVLACDFGTPIGALTDEPVEVDRLSRDDFSLITSDERTGVMRGYRITDRGEATPWPGLTAAVASVGSLWSSESASGNTGHVPIVQVLPMDASAQVIVVFLESQTILSDETGRRAVPALQLYRSDDAGRHFRRVAYGWSPSQARRHRTSGNLPLQTGTPTDPQVRSRQALALSSGVLVLAGNGPKGESEMISCSRDAGRTWARC